MKKSLFKYVTECNKKGIMPKGLNTSYEWKEVMFGYNDIKTRGATTTVSQTVKSFFEKFGYSAKAECVGWRITE